VVVPNPRPGYGSLLFFPLSALIIHPCFNAPMTGDARMKIDDNGPVGDIDEALGIV
jgi:hypothetical protein